MAVYPRLRHEHGDVALERVVVQLERALDQLVVALRWVVVGGGGWVVVEERFVLIIRAPPS